jgi:hypothetical protein
MGVLPSPVAGYFYIPLYITFVAIYLVRVMSVAKDGTNQETTARISFEDINEPTILVNFCD